MMGLLLKKNQNFRNHLSGFTLIEMMVAVAVMVILTTVGVARFREFNTKQEVITVSKEVMSLLRDAQKNAKSGKRPDGCEAHGTLVGYKMVTRNSPVGIDTYAVCGGEDVLEKSTSFANDTVFGNVGEYLFYGLTGGVDNAEIITLTNGDFSYQIEVTSFGAINDLGEVQ